MDKDAIKELLARGGMSLQPMPHPAGGSAILVPHGYALEHLEPKDVLPEFVKAAPTFSEVESFISYVNEYKGSGTKIFGDIHSNRLSAIIDFHLKDKAARLAHIATFTAQLSDEWKPWEIMHGRQMTQVEFAEFIEEHARTVSVPDAATLLEIVQTLESKTDVTFQSKINRSNGTQTLVFQENTDAKGAGSVPVPQELMLAVPVYRGGATYQIKVYLRCQTSTGKAIFTPRIHEKELTKQFAFKQLCERAANETSLGVLHGSAFGRS